MDAGQACALRGGLTNWARGPDDLVEAVEEIHAEVIAGLKPAPEEQALIDRFNELAVAGGSYVGSRIGARFATKYKHLLEG